MLEATVAENISQMSPREIDMKRVQKCAEESGIDKKINQFPKGYDTPVGKRFMRTEYFFREEKLKNCFSPERFTKRLR